MHLERCLRLLPHHNDGGGFFVAVFEKLAEHAAEAGVPPTDEPNPNPNPNPSPKPNPSPSPSPNPNPYPNPNQVAAWQLHGLALSGCERHAEAAARCSLVRARVTG